MASSKKKEASFSICNTSYITIFFFCCAPSSFIQNNSIKCHLEATWAVELKNAVTSTFLPSQLYYDVALINISSQICLPCWIVNALTAASGLFILVSSFTMVPIQEVNAYIFNDNCIIIIIVGFSCLWGSKKLFHAF